MEEKTYRKTQFRKIRKTW